MFDSNPFEKMGKRGEAVTATYIMLIFTTVVVGIVLIAVYFLIGIFGQPHADVPAEASLKVQALTSLKAYLSTPVKLDLGNGKTQYVTMADLLGLAKTSEGYRGKAYNETREIFDGVYGDKYGIEVGDFLVYHKEISEPLSSTEVTFRKPDYLTQESVLIPENITITLYLA